MSIVQHLHVPAIVAFSVPGELWLVPLLAVSLAAAALAGVIPPRGLAGPERIPPRRPAWPLLGVMFGAAGVYLFSASIYVTLKNPAMGNAATTQQFEESPAGMAFLSTVPPLLGFLALLLGGYVSHEVSDQELGLSLDRLPRGVAWGSIGVIIVVPPLFVLLQLLDWIYRRIHYQHPTEHPLLHTLGEKPGAMTTASIIFGACILAPLFEELFFRGYLQTLIRRLLHRLFARREEPTVIPLDSAYRDVPDGPVLQTESPPPTPAETWAAIVITSLFFASVHPKWTSPIIFLLALCLGYAYERTGNLWVSITIHAGFNILSTGLFLVGLYAPH